MTVSGNRTAYWFRFDRYVTVGDFERSAGSSWPGSVFLFRFSGDPPLFVGYQPDRCKDRLCAFVSGNRT